MQTEYMFFNKIDLLPLLGKTVNAEGTGAFKTNTAQRANILTARLVSTVRGNQR